MWSSLEHSPHPATALFSGQEATWTKLSIFSCTEGAETVPLVVSLCHEDAGGEAVLQRHTRSHASWWSHKIDPSPLISTKLKANQKTSECTGLPWPKPVRCFQHSWMRRALFQGCFYGCKLFMLGACKMVMLNKSLLQPAECKVVSRGDLSAHELSLFVKSKQAQDRFKKHQRTKFVQI